MIGQLLANHLVHRASAAGQRDNARRVQLRRGEGSDQCAFAMAQYHQRAHAAVGLEQLAPGHGVGHVGVEGQVTFVGGGSQAGGHAALVVAHTGDVISRQYPGQALEAVIACAVGVVAIAIGGAGAGDDQHHGYRLVGFGQQE